MVTPLFLSNFIKRRLYTLNMDLDELSKKTKIENNLLYDFVYNGNMKLLTIEHFIKIINTLNINVTLEELKIIK